MPNQKSVETPQHNAYLASALTLKVTFKAKKVQDRVTQQKKRFKITDDQKILFSKY